MTLCILLIVLLALLPIGLRHHIVRRLLRFACIFFFSVVCLHFAAVGCLLVYSVLHADAPPKRIRITHPTASPY